MFRNQKPHMLLWECKMVQGCGELLAISQKIKHKVASIYEFPSQVYIQEN